MRAKLAHFPWFPGSSFFFFDWMSIANWFIVDLLILSCSFLKILYFSSIQSWLSDWLPSMAASSTSAPTPSPTEASTRDHASNPYYLHNGDNLGSILVTQLFMDDNYNT